MYLKRLYKEDAGGTPQVTGVEILRAKDRWNVSPDMVAKGAAQGWIHLSQGEITVVGANETVVYTIVRGPGTYCTYCGAAQDDSQSAREHISAKHQGGDTPVDPAWPHGYAVLNHYELQRKGVQNG